MKSLALLLLLVASCHLQAQGPAAQSNAARQFVQGFYDWYVPLANAPSNTPTESIALHERGQDFDSKLGRALRADLERQAKNPEEIVGIDFDPFLNAQDVVGDYVAGAVRSIHGRFHVEVWIGQVGGSADKARVIAEVVRRHGTWQFTNFYYPEGGDPRSLLRRLK